MTTSPGIRQLHWMGVEMDASMALKFEQFKKHHPHLIAGWVEKYHALRKILPVYWDYGQHKWYWAEPPHEHISHYVSMIEGAIKVRELERTSR